MEDRRGLEEAVNNLDWFHSVDFGDGIVASGAKSPAILAEEVECFFGSIALEGRTVLDIGTFNGFHAFEAKRRGAKRVLATDSYIWKAQPVSRAAFELARRYISPDVEDADIDIPDMTRDRLGSFDVVLFAGVFYHLFEPQRYLLQIAELATHLLIVETHQDLLDITRPAMVYYPGATLNNDPSNFWGPNPPLMHHLLSAAGFGNVFYRPHPNGHGRGRYLAFRDRNAVALLRFQGHAPWRDLSIEPAIP